MLWELTTQVIDAAYNIEAVLDMVRARVAPMHGQHALHQCITCVCIADCVSSKHAPSASCASEQYHGEDSVLEC